MSFKHLVLTFNGWYIYSFIKFKGSSSFAKSLWSNKDSHGKTKGK